MTGERKPRVYLQTEFSESQGQVSPDGNYLAYNSNDTGRFEVYVRPFPDAARGRWQISTEGGLHPNWSRDGKELYYAGLNRGIVVALIRLGPGASPSVEVGTQKALVSPETMGAGSGLTNVRYEVGPDGRLLLIVFEEGRDPLTVTLNWAAGRAPQTTPR
ncbi:MAG: TolB family protein, partial [Bryobacteraceae bacterium]